jgi:hypothetical protein
MTDWRDMSSPNYQLFQVVNEVHAGTGSVRVVTARLALLTLAPIQALCRCKVVLILACCGMASISWKCDSCHTRNLPFDQSLRVTRWRTEGALGALGKSEKRQKWFQSPKPPKVKDKKNIGNRSREDRRGST